MAKVRTPKSAWVEAALTALAKGGPDAVKVESLAAQLGVSKGGFYWHFKNRQALINDALDAWETEGTEDVISQVEHETSDPKDKLMELFELAPSAAQGPFAVELALRDWARRDRDIAKRLRRIDQRRMNFLRSMFAEFCPGEDDVEARSLLAYSLLVGSAFIDGHDSKRSRSDMVRLAVNHLVTAT